jgi:hypothetical protein
MTSPLMVQVSVIVEIFFGVSLWDLGFGVWVLVLRV